MDMGKVMSFRPEEETLEILQPTPTLAEVKVGRMESAVRNAVVFIVMRLTGVDLK